MGRQHFKKTCTLRISCFLITTWNSLLPLKHLHNFYLRHFLSNSWNQGQSDQVNLKIQNDYIFSSCALIFISSPSSIFSYLLQITCTFSSTTITLTARISSMFLLFALLAMSTFRWTAVLAGLMETKLHRFCLQFLA